MQSVKQFELYSLTIQSKNIFFDWTQLSTIERRVASNHLFQSFIQSEPHDSVHAETYMNALNFFSCSLKYYSSPLYMQNKTFGTVFFFIRSLSRNFKTLKPRRESWTKVEFDHHRVKTNTQVFYGWKSKVIFGNLILKIDGLVSFKAAVVSLPLKIYQTLFWDVSKLNCRNFSRSLAYTDDCRVHLC